MLVLVLLLLGGGNQDRCDLVRARNHKHRKHVLECDTCEGGEDGLGGEVGSAEIGGGES